MAYTFFKPPMTSWVMRSLLSHTIKWGCLKNFARGFLHLSVPQIRAFAYSLLYISEAMLGPPRYRTLSNGTLAAIKTNNYNRMQSKWEKEKKSWDKA
jgi:hypothetical protein